MMVFAVVSGFVASGVTSSLRMDRLPVAGSTTMMASDPAEPLTPPVSVTNSLPSVERMVMPDGELKLAPEPTAGAADWDRVVRLPVAGSILMTAAGLELTT